MIRTILLTVLFLLLYYSLRTVYRSAVSAYRRGEKRPRIEGKEMVLDPQCRTYVLKERAVVRRFQGRPAYFCSEACAQRYEERGVAKE